jgi:uncharacterized protein
VTDERDRDPAERATRIVLRPIGSSMPLGYVALAGATILIAGLQVHWYPEDDGRVVALLVIAFALPLQLLASVLAFLARDAVSGTAWGLLAGTWLAFGVGELVRPGDSRSPAVGGLLILVGVAVLVPGLAAGVHKVLTALTLGLTGARVGLSGLYELTGAGGVRLAAGVLGVAITVFALYAALAYLLEEALSRTVLPLFRRGKGIEGTFADEVRHLENEAGVRREL